jgi:CRISPR/Cas system-associated exonuclease Cas4 (RecB family)
MKPENLKADLQKFADQAIVKMDEFRLSKRSANVHKSNWASNLHHPCIRFHYYNRTIGNERRFDDTELLYRFEEGNDTERIVIRMFNDIGIDVILAQQYFTWSEYQIGGKIDGMVYVPIRVMENGTIVEKPMKFPLEIKSIAPYFWDSTGSIAEIRDHISIWMQKIVYQLNAYMLMSDKEAGYLVLKSFGKRPRILVMELDYSIAEICVKRAEEINHHLEKKILPPRIQWSNDFCGLCGYDFKCLPVRPSGVVTELPPETLALLDRWGEVVEDGREFNKIDKKLKSDFRDIDEIIVPGFEITGKAGKRKVYNVPDEIKKQFEDYSDSWTVKIVKTD